MGVACQAAGSGLDGGEAVGVVGTRVKRRRPLAHLPEPGCPCCVSALGEFTWMAPREEPTPSVPDAGARSGGRRRPGAGHRAGRSVDGMRIIIAGGHGQIARLLERRLADQGHQPVGIVRNPDHASGLAEAGAEALQGADAVVFAAGGGPDSGPERKLTIDRDGAILLADAAERAGVTRYVMISAMAVDGFDPDSDDTYEIYQRAKSEADADLRARDIDWTIVRPGGLTDDPGTGRIQVGTSTGRGTIPRADVAEIVATALVDGTGVRVQFEAISGEEPVAEAIAGLRY